MAVMPKYYKIHTDGHTVELEPIYTELIPAVREKGEWVYDHWCEFKCSKCGALSKTEPRGEENFCPNCGADMRIEEQNRARGENDG